MRHFTQVKWLVIVLVMLLVSPAVQATAYIVDATYCDGLALMNKATREAKQRGETLPKWKSILRSIQERAVVTKTQAGVLYIVLPKVLEDADKVYRLDQKPNDVYLTPYNSCMKNKYGTVVAVND